MYYLEESRIKFQNLANKIVKKPNLAKHYKHCYSRVVPLSKLMDIVTHAKREKIKTVVIGATIEETLREKIGKDMGVEIISKPQLLQMASVTQLIELEKFLI